LTFHYQWCAMKQMNAVDIAMRLGARWKRVDLIFWGSVFAIAACVGGLLYALMGAK